MSIPKVSADVAEALSDIAFALLFDGEDRAADAIYAWLEPPEPRPTLRLVHSRDWGRET